MNHLDLRDRVAIITGGARGIGHAAAARALGSGASVVIWDIDAARADLAVRELSALGPVSANPVELSDAEAVEAAVEAVLSRHGRIDILVNNAGITGGNAPTWELDPDVWRRVLEVNLTGAFLTCRAIVPHMIARGYGRIVNVASIAARKGIRTRRITAPRRRADRADQVARERARAEEHRRQLHHAGGGANRDLQPDEAGARGLHALEDSDGPLPRARRGRGPDLLARFRGVLVLDRRRLRYQRRPGEMVPLSRPYFLTGGGGGGGGIPFSIVAFLM